MNGEANNCRICLEHENVDHFHRIFPQNCHLALWIFQISGVHVIESNDCPALICDKCILNLENAVELRNNCQQAQNYFRARTKSDLFELEDLNSNEDIPNDIDNQLYCSEATKSKIEDVQKADQYIKAPNKKQFYPPVAQKVITVKAKPKEKCNKCDRSFCDGYLKKHEYFKHIKIPEEDLFECDFCGHKTKTKQLLQNHIITVHSEKPKEKFICGTCGLLLSSKGNLLCHENAHIEIDPSEYIACPICPKTFREKRFMVEHKKLVHDKSKVFPCPHCPHISTCKGAFQKHNKSVHLKIRDFICTDCEASFSSNSQLTRHIRIHTGEKPFNCRSCSKAFRLSSHRKRHEDICPKKDP